MAKPSKGKIARKASYNGSLGAALDEVGFKALGRRIKIRTASALSSVSESPPAKRGVKTDVFESMDKSETRRSLKGTVIVMEYRRCDIRGEMNRKELVTQFKASAPISQVRRGVVGHCERMCG